MDLREEFVILALKPGTNRRELMRRYGISAPTGYKWINRYKSEGQVGLLDRSRRPHIQPGKTRKETEDKIIKLRKKHDYWGARKLHKILEKQGLENLPSTTTVHRILERNALIEKSERNADGIIRFEREHPNELWQMDFKGWFVLENQKRCHALTICDDCSRFNILLEACENEQAKTVQEHLEKSFKRYGLPNAILCDNGSPWGGREGTSRLENWLMKLGIKVLHGRPYHPQTQGKEERFHGTLKHELLNRTVMYRDFQACQDSFDRWRKQYNEVRPHESIQMRTPAEVYRISTRKMPSQLPQPQCYYMDDDVLRKVKSKGEIMFKNQSYSIGGGFIGEQVAMRLIGQKQWEVFYCWKSLGFIDQNLLSKHRNRYQKILKTIEHRNCCAAVPNV